MSIDLSFADIPDRSPIRAGKYEVIVEQIEVKQAEGKEHPYLNWELTIAEGEHEGRKLYMITSLSPKALWGLQNVLQSFGLEDEELEIKFDEETNFVTDPDLSGQSGIATVKNSTYEGRVQAKVIALDGNYEPPKKSKAKPKPKDDDDEDEDEEDEKPAKKSAKPAVKSKAKPKDDEDEDEDEEEEEEKPAKKVVKKPAGKVSPFTKGKGARRPFR